MSKHPLTSKRQLAIGLPFLLAPCLGACDRDEKAEIQPEAKAEAQAVLTARPGAKAPAPLHWAVSSNDAAHVLNDGALTWVENAPPDTLSFIDLTASPPKLAHELAVPGSVIGPPFSVAITPDESLVLVTSSMMADPKDPKKATADDRLTVVDLKAKPPKVVQTLHLGKQPSGVSVTPDGKLALVANRGSGSVSVLAIEGKKVRAVDEVVLSAPGDATQKPQTAHVAITPDGKRALATNDGDHRITLLSIDGQKVSVEDTFYGGLKPYSVDISPDGKVAVVGNLGFGAGDADTLSLVDLEATPPRVVDTVSVGMTPEGVSISPDGSVVVAVLQNGSNKAKASPHYSEVGKLVALKISGKTLKKVSETPIGGWGQGAVFTPDGKRLLVGTMLGRAIEVLAWNEGQMRLESTGEKIAVQGGVAALRTALR